MQLNITSEYTTKVGTQEALIKVSRALFVVVNEVRVLKGQAPLTKQQFISWLKGL
jgi:hypothetical protein